MRSATTTLFIILAASSALAASPMASSCLLAPDAKDCLVSVAKAALTTEKFPDSRAEGFASLISSMAKAGGILGIPSLNEEQGGQHTAQAAIAILKWVDFQKHHHEDRNDQ